MPKADAAVSIDLQRTVSGRAPARTFGDQRPRQQRAAAGGKPTAARAAGDVKCVNLVAHTAPHTPLAAAQVAAMLTLARGLRGDEGPQT